MLDFGKLIDIAGKLNVPGLAERGVKIARDAAKFAALVSVDPARAGHVLATGTKEEIVAINVEAHAAAETLDAKLAAAEKR